MADKIQQMRQSRTMPQLHYTREDIHEQYLSSRLKSGQQHHQHTQNAVKKLACWQNETTASEDDSQSTTCAGGQQEPQTSRDSRTASRQRKRRRRAQSASIFSACFTLPKVLSAGHNQRRSILAHLGLATTNSSLSQSQSQQRPISASQTMGNLKQRLEDCEDRQELTDERLGSTLRKHVSFGAHHSEDVARVEPAAAQVVTKQQQPQPQLAPQAGSQMSAAEQKAANASSSSSSIMNFESTKSANNVITRNYLAHHKQLELRNNNNNNNINQNSEANNLNVAQRRLSPPDSSSPIYLVSQVQRPNQQQQVAHRCQQSRPTVYRRMPNVPMRTQATQTEITAYHLMATPLISPRLQPATPESTSAGAEMPTQVAQWSGKRFAEPDKSNLFGGSEVGLVRLPDQLSDEWSAPEEDEDEEKDQQRQLDLAGSGVELAAASLMSSSSDSQTSLVGHDSTLLLQADLELSKQQSGSSCIAGAEQTSIMIADSSIDHKLSARSQHNNQMRDKLKNDNNAKRSSSDRILPEASEKPKPVEDIEPPSEFMDSTREPRASPDLNSSSSSSSSSSMNMNAPLASDNRQPISVEHQQQQQQQQHQSSLDNEMPDWTPDRHLARDERAPSPPSLSEASSQTDASSIPLIMNIGRSMGRGSQEAGPSREASRNYILERASTEPERDQPSQSIESDTASSVTVDQAEYDLLSNPDRTPTASLRCAQQEDDQDDMIMEDDNGLVVQVSSTISADLEKQIDWQTEAATLSPESIQLRRDEFLADQGQQHPTTTTSSILIRSKRPSTSTSSVRHHSYFSSRDLTTVETAGELAVDEQQQQQQMDDGSIIDSGKPSYDRLNSIDEQQDGCSELNSSFVHSRNSLLTESAACKAPPSSPVAPQAEPDTNKVAAQLTPLGQLDDPPLVEAADGPSRRPNERSDGGTIKQDCRPAFITAGSDHKSSESAKWSSPPQSLAAGDSLGQFAASISSQVLRDASEELAIGETLARIQQDSLETSSSAKRKSNQQQSMTSSSWSLSATSSSSSSSSLLVASGDESALHRKQFKQSARSRSNHANSHKSTSLDQSSPTTVSELGQDEELSTPSFLDSYRNRLDEIRNLAESLADYLLSEALLKDAPEAMPKASLSGRSEANSSSSSSTSETSTSLSGHSYVCCQPGHSSEQRAPPAAPQRPKIPAKPAHLSKPDVKSEAAAALAVATTSVAAAAAAANYRKEQPAEQLIMGQEDKARQVEPVEEDSLRKRPADLSQAQLANDESRAEPALDDVTEEQQQASSCELPFNTPALTSRSGSICSAGSVVAARRRSSEFSFVSDASTTRNVEQSQQTANNDNRSSSSSSQDDESRTDHLTANLCQESELSEQQQQPEEPSQVLDGGEQSFEARRSSQELSTVSEVSEEMSNAQAQLMQKRDAGSHRDDDDDDQDELSGSKRGGQQEEEQLGGFELATEQDLAHSEYSLRSQCSETAMLTMASESSLTGEHQQHPQQHPQQQLHQWQPPVHRQSSPLELHRRRSVGAPGVAQSSSKIHTMKSSLDCPFVHDIISPPPPASPDPTPSSSRAPPFQLLAAHHQRLSHDDTMEAIEDDVEGEEQELQSQLEFVPPVELMRIEPPAGFSSEPLNGQAGDRCKPDNEQQQLNEEQQDEDEDEESSISISQHGVLVEQHERVETSSSRKRRGSDSSSSDSSSLTPLNSRNEHQANTEQGVRATPEVKPANQSRSEQQPLPVASSKSSSTESATQAILEHLSRHHPDLALDEPSLELEQSRCVVEPTQRRKLWRRESNSTRLEESSASLESQSGVVVGAANDHHSEPVCTGTIKRRTSSTSGARQVVVAESSPHSMPARRGPPLSQLKACQESEQKSRQVSGSLPTTTTTADNSICSSCSCMEASFDSQQPPLPSGSGASRHSLGPTLASGPSGERAAWMSQEEGTVITENYWLAHWLYISEHEESEIWRRAIDMSIDQQATTTSVEMMPGMPREMPEMASTRSERNFSTKYKSTTRKMIHRRATIEMYKRIMNNNLKREKRVEISRSNGEFGFRIHGSRPVVVSAIERGTSAETCGLQVGDLIYAINDTNILDMAHSDVVKLAHTANSSALVLDLVPTNDFLRSSRYNRASNKNYEPTVTGFLMRLSTSTAQPMLIELQERMANLPGASSQQRASKLNEVMRLAWRQRYFVLRSDNCLYWYSSASDIEPYGGINLQGFSASLTNEFSEPSHVIRLVKYGGQPHYLGTNNLCDIQTWIDAINKAATEANQNDPYMRRTLTLARTKPSEIVEPDCNGYLYKFSQKRAGGAHWRAAYFVLKDACLYLFRDQQAELVSQASAVYYLHGYRVRSKHIENKKHTFELIPPNRKTIRPMFLMATSEIDKKRWIAALDYSIDRWIEID